MRAAVVVVTIRIVLLSMLLVVIPCVVYNIYNDGGNVVVVGDWGGIICGSAVKDFFGDGTEGILI